MDTIISLLPSLALIVLACILLLSVWELRDMINRF